MARFSPNADYRPRKVSWRHWTVRGIIAIIVVEALVVAWLLA